MITGFTRNSDEARPIKPVAITGVDAATRTATAIDRWHVIVTINTAFAVGDAIIVPSVGEQWYVERMERQWRLYGRIPHNDPTLTIEPAPGQVSVGAATGPLELNGTSLNAHGPLRLQSVATATRPDATSAGAGAMIYDLTLGMPIFSNGTDWTNALGSVV